jgi:hypothetical protein
MPSIELIKSTLAVDPELAAKLDGLTLEEALAWWGGEERETAHDLLAELVAVVKTIPAEFTDDHQDLGDRIKNYLGED